MAVVAHGWARVEREVRPRTGLALIHVPTCLAYWRDRGRTKDRIGVVEDRAPCYDHKQRMTTVEAWASRRKVGPALAAEIRKIEGGLLLKTGRYSPLWKH